jgi:hypothetical protein
MNFKENVAKYLLLLVQKLLLLVKVGTAQRLRPLEVATLLMEKIIDTYKETIVSRLGLLGV